MKESSGAGWLFSRLSLNRRILGYFSVSLSLLILLPACERPQQTVEATPPAASDRSFDVRGIMHAVDPDQKTIMVEHEEIPGFMAAMTMPFYYKDFNEVRDIPTGSAIAFRFIVTDSDSWVTDLKVIRAEDLKLKKAEEKSGSRAPRVREGDLMPEFHLVTQDDHALTRGSLQGRATLLTFIFTRCPVPNFCPLMTSRFHEFQERISKDPALAEKLHLLSISFDPEDTPDALATYARRHTANPKIWTHASGSEEESGKLTQAFSVYVRQEGGSYSHALCTALVKADGTIARIWRGNDWSVDEVWKEVEALPK